MPRLVAAARGIIDADTKFEATQDAEYLKVAADETLLEFTLDRVESYDLATDTITKPFVDVDSQRFREVCRWNFEISYDGGVTWDSLGRGATGPEVLRIPTEDPDATKPVLEKTSHRMRLRPERGQGRVIRYTIDCIEGMETELALESRVDGPSRTTIREGGSVTFEDSSSGSAAGASSVSSGNVTGAGSNRAAFAFGGVAGSTSLTVSSFDINGSAATAVTGGTVEQTGAGAEAWAYEATGTPASAYDADFTASGTANDIFCVLQAHSDVDQTTPYDNVATDSNNYFPSTFNGTSATSATNDRVIDYCQVTDFSAATTWTGTPDTANFPEDLSSGESIVRSGHEAGAATVTIGYDYTASVSSAIYIYFNIKEATTSVTVTDVDTDETWNDGDTGLVITGTGFVT